jgi:hypothetical protein
MNLFKFADIRRGKDSSDRVGQFMLGSYIILFLLFLVLPLGSLISKSLENKDGRIYRSCKLQLISSGACFISISL